MQLNKEEILNIIFKYIPKDECSVFLFGSFAKGEYFKSSDIDIGIIGAKPVDSRALVTIRDEMEKVRTLRDIDIVDFADISDKSFMRIALKEIKVWHQTKKSKIYLSNLVKQI